MLENYIAPYNAGVIEFRSSWSRSIRKTNLDELGQGSSTENSVFPVKIHGFRSSSGDASACSCFSWFSSLCFRSDAGGSVRQPASFTNLSGLKPSYGLISRWGLMSLSSSTDTIGIITKTAQESALI